MASSNPTNTTIPRHPMSNSSSGTTVTIMASAGDVNQALEYIAATARVACDNNNFAAEAAAATAAAAATSTAASTITSTSDGSVATNTTTYVILNSSCRHQHQQHPQRPSSSSWSSNGEEQWHFPRWRRLSSSPPHHRERRDDPPFEQRQQQPRLEHRYYNRLPPWTKPFHRSPEYRSHHQQRRRTSLSPPPSPGRQHSSRDDMSTFTGPRRWTVYDEQQRRQRQQEQQRNDRNHIITSPVRSNRTRNNAATPVARNDEIIELLSSDTDDENNISCNLNSNKNDNNNVVARNHNGASREIIELLDDSSSDEDDEERNNHDHSHNVILDNTSKSDQNNHDDVGAPLQPDPMTLMDEDEISCHPNPNDMNIHQQYQEKNRPGLQGDKEGEQQQHELQQQQQQELQQQPQQQPRQQQLQQGQSNHQSNDGMPLPYHVLFEDSYNPETRLELADDRIPRTVVDDERQQSSDQYTQNDNKQVFEMGLFSSSRCNVDHNWAGIAGVAETARSITTMDDNNNTMNKKRGRKRSGRLDPSEIHCIDYYGDDENNMIDPHVTTKPYSLRCRRKTPQEGQAIEDFRVNYETNNMTKLTRKEAELLYNKQLQQEATRPVMEGECRIQTSPIFVKQPKMMKAEEETKKKAADGAVVLDKKPNKAIIKTEQLSSSSLPLSATSSVITITNFWDKCYDNFIIHYHGKRWRCAGESNFYYRGSKYKRYRHKNLCYPKLFQFVEVESTDYNVVYWSENDINCIIAKENTTSSGNHM